MSNSNITHYPISFYLTNKIAEFRLETEKVDNCACKTVRLIASEAGFLLNSLIALVETIFWAALAISAKFIHLFIPESRAKWIDDHIFEPIVFNATHSLAAMSNSLLLTVIQVASIDTIENCLKSLKDTLKCFNNKIVKPISLYHIC